MSFKEIKFEDNKVGNDKASNKYSKLHSLHLTCNNVAFTVVLIVFFHSLYFVQYPHLRCKINCRAANSKLICSCSLALIHCLFNMSVM